MQDVLTAPDLGMCPGPALTPHAGRVRTAAAAAAPVGADAAPPPPAAAAAVDGDVDVDANAPDQGGRKVAGKGRATRAKGATAGLRRPKPLGPARPKLKNSSKTASVQRIPDQS